MYSPRSVSTTLRPAASSACVEVGLLRRHRLALDDARAPPWRCGDLDHDAVGVLRRSPPSARGRRWPGGAPRSAPGARRDRAACPSWRGGPRRGRGRRPAARRARWTRREPSCGGGAAPAPRAGSCRPAPPARAPGTAAAAPRSRQAPRRGAAARCWTLSVEPAPLQAARRGAAGSRGRSSPGGRRRTASTCASLRSIMLAGDLGVLHREEPAEAAALVLVGHLAQLHAPHRAQQRPAAASRTPRPRSRWQDGW